MASVENVGCKIMSGIKSIYADSSACVRVKGVKVSGLEYIVG